MLTIKFVSARSTLIVESPDVTIAAAGTIPDVPHASIVLNKGQDSYYLMEPPKTSPECEEFNDFQIAYIMNEAGQTIETVRP